MPLEAYTQTVPLNRPNVPGAILYANNEMAYAASFQSSEPAAVPEPAILHMLMIGVMGLAAARRKGMGLSA